MLVRILVFGEKNTGKTQLVKRLFSQKPFNSPSKPTMGIDHFKAKTRTKPATELVIWDSGQDYQSLVKTFWQAANIALYCIDLSDPSIEVKIKTNIKAFKEKNSAARIILIGTKVDLASEHHKTVFNNLCIKEVDARFITSTKQNTGIEDLLAQIDCIADLYQRYSLITVESEEKALFKKLMFLSKTKLATIKGYLNSLKANIYTEPNAVSGFLNRCEVLLKGEKTQFIKAVFAFTAVAIVTALAALIGFGLGFAVGWWLLGPAALVTAVMAAKVAAVSIVSLSVSAGFIAAGTTATWDFFKDYKTKTALTDFTKNIEVERAQACLS